MYVLLTLDGVISGRSASQGSHHVSDLSGLERAL
jgi:hypothetical protein